MDLYRRFIKRWTQKENNPNGDSCNYNHSIKRQRADSEKKIDALTAGGLAYYNSIFKQMALANPGNADILSQFLTAENTEQNIKLTTRLAHIKIICWFNRHSDYENFQQITKNHVVEYLGSLRKTETQDPSHKWIGTYNTRQMILVRR